MSAGRVARLDPWTRRSAQRKKPHIVAGLWESDAMRRLLWTLLLAAALVVPAGAHAQSAERYPLVVDRSMAGVRLGMTKNEVRAVLGSPTHSRPADDVFGPVRRWYFQGPKTHFYFRSGASGSPEVTAMLTRRGYVRGSSNSGVGTPESALRERIEGLNCETSFGRRSCHTGDFRAGEVVTDFRMRGGRVASIFLGYVID